MSHSKVRRILRKYRGPYVKKAKVKSQRKFPNLLIKITNDLVKHPKKLARGNWILKDGKNGYRKLIEPTRPYQLWAADWKEFKISFLNLTIYIFAIIDVYTRQLKGYNFALIKNEQAAAKAAHTAVDNSRQDPLFNPRRLIVHSDQGSAYVSNGYIAFWEDLGAHLSMADRGKPTQNPYIEAFFSILSRFWLSQREYISAIEVEQSLTKFFNLYNREWKHTGIDNLTPNEALDRYRSGVG
jgi:transposase InsO family protein